MSPRLWLALALTSLVAPASEANAPPPLPAPSPARAPAPAPVAAPAKARTSATARDPLAPAAAALRAGRYEEALRLADAFGRRRHDGGAVVLAARAEMATGLYEKARTRLTAALDDQPRNLPARQALGELLALLGDRAALKPLLDATYDDWSNGHVALSNAGDLMAVAALIGLDDNWQDANDTLRAAVRAAPRNPAPNIAWGSVFLEKHAVSEAEASFTAALEIDPRDPDALVGMAMVHLEKSYDVAAADRSLAAALAVNPRHAGALGVRAEMALDGEDFDGAAARIADIRRSNARDPGAAALAAARALLLDDTAGYARERDAHAALHKADGDFFAAVADMLIHHRRTEDARAVAAEGVAVDPDNARCQSMLGTTLLRLGDEGPGLEALRRAWKRDPYDARTYNLLELYDKVVPSTETFTTQHLAFRIDRSAHAAIAEVVAPFLEKTYRHYAGKYGFEPKGPILFELYANPKHYAVRTVGLPGIGVEAVCFGRVITSQSPTNAALNWGMALAHELAHVFAIELSRSRVPRWFTEGLAELETMRARPEWRRHADRSLWGALQRHQLDPLASLSNAFIHARSSEEATRAYAESAAALDYLDRRFGFARIRDALVRFGRGERGLAVLTAATGASAADLEDGFRADLAARTARFDRQYLPAELLEPIAGDDDAPPASPPGGQKSRAGGSAAAPRTAAGRTSGAPRSAEPGKGQGEGPVEAKVRRGLERLRAGDLDAATRALRSIEAVPGAINEPSVVFFSGELALARKDAEAARAAFLSLVGRGASEGGGDGYDLRIRLALAEIHRHDFAAAEAHLRRAIGFDPESAEATGLLVELLGDPVWQGRRADDRLAAVAATLRLEPLHAALANEWVAGLLERKRFEELMEAAQTAIFIDPARPFLQVAWGRALAAAGKKDQAAAAFRRALALGPTPGEASDIRRLLAETAAK